MVELRGIKHRYASRVVLDLEQFTVPRNGALAVVGHNGSGKSTLLRLLALLETPTKVKSGSTGNSSLGARRPRCAAA